MNFNTENFPDINFIEDKTIDQIRTQMINDYLQKYEEITGRQASLSQANPYRLILYACAVQIYQAMQYADHAGKMGFLTYATGDYLDHLAALRGIKRIESTSAMTVLQFTIEKAISTVVPIPAGSRVSNGNGVYFATDEYTEILEGQTSISVSATCTETGAAGNGFEIGELNVLVNTIPYIVSVCNTIETYGGTDRETDESLKERVFEAPEGYSTTGPVGAYEYHVKNAMQGIEDVVVLSEKPGEVDIYFTTNNGGIPNSAMIQKVEEYLNDKTIRPLTDKISVRVPEEAICDIDITYYIAASDKAAVSEIQTKVESAVAAYSIWQTEKIGRDINPSHLIKKVMDAGVKRITVKSPSFTILNGSTIAKIGNVTVNYGGVEDD